MKAICIGTKSDKHENLIYTELVIGKVYDVDELIPSSLSYEWYGIGLGRSSFKFVPRSLFITLEEHRSNILKEIFKD